MFSNDGVKTVEVDVTSQFQTQAHGGIITVWLDCSQLEPPPAQGENSTGLFVPTLEDYDHVYWEIEM